MQIGFVQFAPKLGSPSDSMRRIEALLPRCEGVDLVVLPELAHSGYSFITREQAWELSEEIGTGAFVDFLISQCRKYRFHLVAGVNERERDKLFNTAVLVSPEGFIGKYRKIHLFWDEPDIFQPGNSGLPVFDLGFCRIGMLICLDWIFPEVWRILALQGADLIAHPSNLVLPYCQQAVPVHALINRVYVVTANRVGSEGDITFTGGSIIADPKGAVLCRADQRGEEVGIAEMNVSLARDKMMTPRNHLLKDRRPQEYSLLTQE
ncbi:MAG: nitrilase-related carbon-nitrogen hydrolase [bacterium]